MDIAITVAVLAALVAVLVRELVPPSAAILGALTILVVAGVVEPEVGFSGFSNTATLTIAGLFVVARAVQDHSGLERALQRLLGTGDGERRVLARLVAPIAGSSAVIANTPLVATLAPMVRTWAERHGLPASRLLMPVSFAAILGGVLTVIGTSTTLLVSGLVESLTGEAFGFLEITPLGLPVALIGAGLLVLLAPRLLVDRSSPHEQIAAHERDYTFRMKVEPGGPLDGVSIRDAELRNLANVYLAGIHRRGGTVTPVGPDEPLQGGDDLVFVGQVDQVRGLTSRPGLVHAEQDQIQLLDGDQHGLHEVVIGRNSYLVGRTLKEVSFRGRYDAAVLALHRSGERVEHKLGTVPLDAGDSLLVQADTGFPERWRGSGDFALVVPLDDHLHAASPRRWFVLAVAAGMVALAASGLTSTFVAVLVACAALVGTRTVKFWQAKAALDLDVLIIIAGAIGVGAAVEASGLAGEVASGIAAVAEQAGTVGALAAVVVGTLVLTELITNVAAAALMVPIALQVATQVGADPRGFAVAVAVAASASFLTPIGYQTNTIVYGLGGYRFTDYWRLGLPLTLTVLATTLVVVPAVWS